MDRPRSGVVQDWLAAHDPLHVTALPDEVIDRLGHDPRGVYPEMYWLPMLGPSALWALRRLTAWLETEPDGLDVSLNQLAGELGLGHGAARNSPIVRCLARLVAFDLARMSPTGLAVRPRVPPLARRHLRQIPEHLASQITGGEVA